MCVYVCVLMVVVGFTKVVFVHIVVGFEQDDMKRKANAAKERARAKAQKEEQERNSRSQAVPNLNALDIPAELATIFSKIDGKSEVHEV